MLVKKQQLKPDMEQWTGSKLGKKRVKAAYCHIAYLPGYEAQAGIKIARRNINNLTYADAPPLWQKVKGN